MAKNVTRKPSKHLNQASFEDFVVPQRGVRIRVDESRKAFLPTLKPGQVLVFHADIGFDEAQVLLDLSDIESKDRSESKKGKVNEELAVIDGMAADIKSDLYSPNGDPMILNRRGGTIEGIKTLLAIQKSGRVVRMLIVYGVDKEARFSTDDTLKTPNARKSEYFYREQSLPEAAPASELSGFDASIRDDMQRAFELRDKVSLTLGYPVLPHLTAGSLQAGIAGAGALGIPVPMELLIRACLDLVAPRSAVAFMSAWAGFPAIPASSASKLKGRHLRKGLHDEVGFLTTVAIAIEAFVDGSKIDPYQARAKSRREPNQLLQVLFGYRNRLPERLVSCRIEKFDTNRLIQIAEGSGRWPMSKSEMERITPLLRDVRRNRGLILTGQTLKFDENDILLDGFDRVAACLLAGRTLVSFASYNFRPGFDHARPRGRKQGVGHRYYADGCAYTWDMQSVLRNAFRLSENDRTIRSTNTTLRHMHHLHPQVQDIVMFVHQLEDLVKISALGAAHLVLSRFSRDLADSFSSELYEVWKGELKVEEERHRTLEKLVETLEAIKLTKGYDNDHTICIILQAMDAWCWESEMGEFLPLPKVGFYRLSVPPQIVRIQEEAIAIRALRKKNLPTAGQPASV